MIWISAGDGSFFALQNSNVPVDAGRGLGLIIADLDEQPGLDVFVGNDGTADFMLINEQESAGGTARFRDEATLCGVALNGKGRMQATMGVAYGDVDRDGTADLFQANFYGEANTVYFGLGDGYFNDATARAGLYTTSLAMLGWGTEFLDADLDGWPDLVVMNGHLEDRTRFGEPFRMPAQIFRNDGQGRFLKIDVNAAGEWFGKPRLGRALATVDWNRDWQTDLAVTSLDSPAALLFGDTNSVGNFISIHLRGTISERDAIGAKVVLEAAGIRQFHQLTTGDGFQTSNQRRIHVGLGEARIIDRLSVAWPSGVIQEWESLSVNQKIVLVEGRNRPSSLIGDAGFRQ
ncbi:MAG: CRTAC1 family protein [Planctomycetales bacterium]